jgi:hypothetical protein
MIEVSTISRCMRATARGRWLPARARRWLAGTAALSIVVARAGKATAEPRFGLDMGIGGVEIGTLGVVFAPGEIPVELRAGGAYNGGTLMAVASIVAKPISLAISGDTTTSILFLGSGGHGLLGATSGRLFGRPQLSADTLDFGGFGSGVEVGGRQAAFYADVRILWFTVNVSDPAENVRGTARGWLAPVPRIGAILYF